MWSFSLQKINFLTLKLRILKMVDDLISGRDIVFIVIGFIIGNATARRLVGGVARKGVEKAEKKAKVRRWL